MRVRTKRRRAVAVTVCAGVVIAAAPAGADDGGGIGVGTSVDSNGDGVLEAVTVVMERVVNGTTAPPALVGTTDGSGSAANSAAGSNGAGSAGGEDRGGATADGASTGGSSTASACSLVPRGQTRMIEGVVHELWEYSCITTAGDPFPIRGLYWLPQGVPPAPGAAPAPPVVFPVVTVADILPGAVGSARSRVPSPVVEFLALDPEFGWVYVTVPFDFRVTNLEPVSASASAVSGPYSASVTVTATPVRVIFEPGEPGGRAVVCSPAGAAAGYSPDRPGECSYVYDNSSAISGNGRTFTTTVTVDWDVSYVSSEGPGVLEPMTLSTSTELGVAEIQALVTCTGPRPEQGGCG